MSAGAGTAMLDFEDPPVIGQPIHGNFLLYGKPKSGKTAGATSAPGPVLYLTADTPNATRYAELRYGPDHFVGRSVVRIKGMRTLDQVKGFLNSEEGRKVETVVLDPVGEVYRVLLEDFSNRARRPQIQLYGDVQTELERFCRALCESSRLNFVMVCHESTRESDTGEGQMTEKVPFSGPSKDKLSNKLTGMVDVVAYTAAVDLKLAEDSSETKRVYAARLFSANGTEGGDRFDCLGDFRELNLAEWIATASNYVPAEAAARAETDAALAEAVKAKEKEPTPDGTESAVSKSLKEMKASNDKDKAPQTDKDKNEAPEQAQEVAVA